MRYFDIHEIEGRPKTDWIDAVAIWFGVLVVLLAVSYLLTNLILGI